VPVHRQVYRGAEPDRTRGNRSIRRAQPENAGERRVIGALPVWFEELLPFLIPGVVFVCGLIGYGVLVFVYRWIDDEPE
jgi:hypothetical protein